MATAQIDRACGVLLGAACGDALGAGYEFGVATPGPEGPRMIGGGLGDFAPGEWTDDTSMLFPIAEVAATKADLRTTDALDAIARRFREWYDGGPADVGIQTSSVLDRAGTKPTAETMTRVAAELHQRTGKSGGNGSLMRTAPVALAHLGDPAGLVDAAMKVSALTHYDPRAGEACALWCLGIRHAVVTGELPDLRELIGRLADDAQEFWTDRIDEAEQRDPATFTPNGYVVTALQAAWAVVKTVADVEVCELDNHPVVAGLNAAIAIGNDTDTVAAIAGAMLGARWGASAIPAEWRRVVHGWPGKRAEDLVHLAHLAATKGPGIYGWPSQSGSTTPSGTLAPWSSRTHTTRRSSSRTPPRSARSKTLASPR
nr:ADP-ribosylglycohydrolase family protein [Nocardioides thalensis]